MNRYSSISKLISSLVLFILFSHIQLSAQIDLTPDEALAPVKINGKWGYINKLGKFAVLPRYDNAGVFTEGVAPVQVSIFWGYIDKKGQWALKPVFTRAANFSNKRALVSIFEPHDSVTINGYITHIGELLFQLEPFEVGHEFHDDMLLVRSVDSRGMAFGFKDSAGKYAISPRFDAAMSFSEGLAPIMLGNKWGFTNLNNDYEIFPIYEQVFNFNEGLAYTKLGDKTGFINKKGKMVINLSKYDEVAPFVMDEMIPVRKEGKMGYVNTKGKLVIKPQFDNQLFSYFSDSMAAVAVKSTDGSTKYGYINKEGKIVIPAIYDEAYEFSEGLARIKKNGLYGFIDKKGKIIADPIFEDAEEFTPTYK